MAEGRLAASGGRPAGRRGPARWVWMRLRCWEARVQGLRGGRGVVHLLEMCVVACEEA
jgi:hypothetical protein